MVKNAIKAIIRKDLILISILIVILVLIKIPSMTMLIRGDVHIYSELSESLIQEQRYLFEGKEHNKYPIGYPAINIPFMLLSDNPELNYRIASLFWTAISIAIIYLLARRLKIPKVWSFIACLIVIVNPWFYYFTTVIPGSESSAIMLYLLGIYFWHLDEKKQGKFRYLSSLFFGLAIITRYLFAFMILPFFIYDIYEIIKRDRIKQRIVSGIIASAPLGLWMLRNLVVFASPEPGGYAPHLAYWIHAPMMASIFLIFVPIATFSILLPQIVLQSIREIKKKNLFWILILTGIVAKLVAHVFLSYNPEPSIITMVISRLRYAIALVPVLSLLAVLHVKSWKGSLKKNSIKIFSLIMIIFIIMTAYWNSGWTKDQADKIIPTPSIFSQRAEQRDQAVEWMNTNLPENAQVYGGFSEGKRSCGIIEINHNLDKVLRDDIKYKCIDYNNDTKELCSISDENSYLLIEDHEGCQKKSIYSLKKGINPQIIITKS